MTNLELEKFLSKYVDLIDRQSIEIEDMNKKIKDHYNDKWKKEYPEDYYSQKDVIKKERFKLMKLCNILDSME